MVAIDIGNNWRSYWLLVNDENWLRVLTQINPPGGWCPVPSLLSLQIRRQIFDVLVLHAIFSICNGIENPS